MDFTKIALSVAIVTRNRAESLKGTLESLSIQNPKPFEIIISDDSDNENQILLNKELALQYGGKYFTGPKKGLYANRNFVAEKCIGTHIRTMDDDHEFPENHFKECIEAIAKDPEAIWTIGEYSPPNEDRSLPAPIPGQLHPKGFAYKPKDMNKYFGISCGASIYPKSVFDKKILNLDTYKFGILYLEYGARLRRQGYKIKHLPSTFVIHKSFATTASELHIKSIDECRVFCMLMLSFKNQVTLLNIYSTTFQLIYEIMIGKISLTTLFNAIKKYRIESSKIKFS